MKPTKITPHSVQRIIRTDLPNNLKDLLLQDLLIQHAVALYLEQE